MEHCCSNRCKPLSLTKVNLLYEKLVGKSNFCSWCSIGINTKTESCGKGPEFRRPILIVKKLSSNTCFVIPLSTKNKTGTWYANYEIDGVQYTALLYQLKMMHTNRFTKFEMKLDREKFLEIKKRLKFLLNL